MTNELITEGKKICVEAEHHIGLAISQIVSCLSRSIDEIERLRGENQRLRMKLTAVYERLECDGACPIVEECVTPEAEAITCFDCRRKFCEVEDPNREATGSNG